MKSCRVEEGRLTMAPPCLTCHFFGRAKSTRRWNACPREVVSKPHHKSGPHGVNALKKQPHPSAPPNARVQRILPIEDKLLHRAPKQAPILASVFQNTYSGNKRFIVQIADRCPSPAALKASTTFFTTEPKDPFKIFSVDLRSFAYV